MTDVVIQGRIWAYHGNTTKDAMNSSPKPFTLTLKCFSGQIVPSLSNSNSDEVVKNLTFIHLKLKTPTLDVEQATIELKKNIGFSTSYSFCDV